MTSNNEYFTPEQVDEQIEQLRQQSAAHEQINEAQLVDMLQRHYQVSLVAEDQATLAHARQRMLENLDNQSVLDYEPQFVNVRATRPFALPKRARLTRLLSSIAAVLVISTLVASWFVVTHLANPPIVATGSTQSNLYTIHSGIAYGINGSTGNVIWQRPVPTRKLTDFNHGGSAQLIVANSTVYALLDFDLYALDASTGNQRWHIINHGPKEYFYMVVDSARLYLFSLDNTFSAFDAYNGTQLWHNTTFTTENGYGFSVLDGNLYTQTSDPNPQAQKLYALDGATGQVRWSYPLKDGSLFSPPLVANGVVYFSSGNILAAVKEQNGDKIWEKQMPTTGGLESLYVANDRLYVNGGSVIASLVGEAGSIDNTGGINKAIYALDTRNGQILWTSDPDFNAFQLPITNGLLLSQRQHNGSYGIAGLDAGTGKAIWQVPFTCNGGVVGNPESPGGASPSCGVLWSEVTNGVLYLLESDMKPPSSNQRTSMIYTLKSFNPHTGQLLSEHPLESSQYLPFAIGTSNGLLYATTYIPREANTIPYSDIVFVAYRLNDGTQAWQHAMPPFPAPQGANTSPNTSGAVLFP